MIQPRRQCRLRLPFAGLERGWLQTSSSCKPELHCQCAPASAIITAYDGRCWRGLRGHQHLPAQPTEVQVQGLRQTAKRTSDLEVKMDKVAAGFDDKVGALEQLVDVQSSELRE